jgi:hypothetical protein
MGKGELTENLQQTLLESLWESEDVLIGTTMDYLTEQRPRSNVDGYHRRRPELNPEKDEGPEWGRDMDGGGSARKSK